MDTTNGLINLLRDAVTLMNSGVLQMQQSKDELTETADWYYAELISAGMTPTQISAAVPGVEVFA